MTYKPKQFRKASEVLRNEKNYRFSLAYSSLSVREGYSSYYWSRSNHHCDLELWNKAAKLGERYRRFVHYCKEIEPDWTETGNRANYSEDGKIVTHVEQVNKHGETRWVYEL